MLLWVTSTDTGQQIHPKTHRSQKDGKLCFMPSNNNHNKHGMNTATKQSVFSKYLVIVFIQSCAMCMHCIAYMQKVPKLAKFEPE